MQYFTPVLSATSHPLLGAVQPGVASVHASILQKAPNGVAFYIRDFPSMASMTYGDIRRRFNTSVLCGWFSGDHQPHLNPKDDHILQKTDKLIFLANTGINCGSAAWLVGAHAAVPALLTLHPPHIANESLMVLHAWKTNCEVLGVLCSACSNAECAFDSTYLSFSF